MIIDNYNAIIKQLKKSKEQLQKACEEFEEFNIMINPNDWDKLQEDEKLRAIVEEIDVIRMTISDFVPDEYQ